VNFAPYDNPGTSRYHRGYRLSDPSGAAAHDRANDTDPDYYGPTGNSDNQGRDLYDQGGNVDNQDRDPNGQSGNIDNQDRDSNGQSGNIDNPNDNADISVMADTKSVTFMAEARPFMKNGYSMIPVIPVLRSEGIPYRYDRNTLEAKGPYQPVTATFGNPVVVGSNNHQFRLAAPLQWIHGVIYAPARFFALATGKKVNYDADSHTIVIGNTEYAPGQ
jgi:hypothetical protein